jgi:RNA polymerase sigma-70 factor, ECF subfamily
LKIFKNTSTRDSSKDLNRRELEQTLIAAAQAGSSAAFSDLYRLHAKALYRIAFSFTRNREDAEDALQDAFLRAYTGLASFRREAQFYSWIVRITINSSLMILRKHRNRREVSVDAAGPEETTNSFDLADARPGPGDFFDQGQVYAHLMRSIEGLPGHLRVVVEHRLLCERSIDETRNLLGISEAAIKSRLFRARGRLAAQPGLAPPDRPVQPCRPAWTAERTA